MKYALIAPDGHRIVQTGEVPEGMIELQGGDLLALPAPEEVGDATHYWDGAALQPYPPKPAPWMQFDFTAQEWQDLRSPAEVAAQLDTARLAAVARINALTGMVRRRFVTDIPGQEALYLMKEAEARAWLAATAPDPAQFPLITAEVGITAPDADQVAQVYVNLAAIWLQTAASLETARLGHILAAETAATPDAADAAAQAFAALIATFS
ncbi:hypothetical protein [Paracoccus sp. (in: a-proteobacteria)]|uniref:hypothetical protein n=1 Tax=Paracoccus sp. TaxID=267 RepID=UPI00321FE8BB